MNDDDTATDRPTDGTDDPADHLTLSLDPTGTEPGPDGVAWPAPVAPVVGGAAWA